MAVAAAVVDVNYCCPLLIVNGCGLALSRFFAWNGEVNYQSIPQSVCWCVPVYSETTQSSVSGGASGGGPLSGGRKITQPTVALQSLSPPTRLS